jgi:hypothetical protein
MPKPKIQARHKVQKKDQPTPQHRKITKSVALDSMDSQEACFKASHVSKAQCLEKVTSYQAPISLCVCENYDPCCANSFFVCAN